MQTVLPYIEITVGNCSTLQECNLHRIVRAVTFCSRTEQNTLRLTHRCMLYCELLHCTDARLQLYLQLSLDLFME